MIRILKLIVVLLCLISINGCTPPTPSPSTFTNPIIPGSHPDPSICRVGDDYYIANSSFIWFPGVPIHHSKDLVNWKLIGYALHTPEHIDINDVTGVAGGDWAPTIRYHEGLFYLTVTQKRCGSSILTTAKNPAGPWSKPITLHSEKGIDGSLLFDEDKTWYCWSEDHLILLKEFDKEKMELKGDSILLLNEQMFGDDYSHIEGPHIYKLESGEYMLLIASGGTGNNRHNVSVFKSDKPQGPYEPCPHNPVLTHDGTESPINNTGHADIVKTQNGEWYAVMLGVRPNEKFTIMDRETFMVKFTWENGWPVFPKSEIGSVLAIDSVPHLPWTPVEPLPDTDEFEAEKLGLEYNFYHTPHKKWWSLSDKPGALRIYAQAPKTTDQTNTPLIARRITQFDFDASTEVTFQPQNEETAGLIALMNQRGQMRLELFTSNDKKYARVVSHIHHRKSPLEVIVSDSVEIQSESVEMKLVARGLDYHFYIGEKGKELQPIGDTIHGKIISKQRAGGYSGAYVGMFCSSNGQESENYADFERFSYKTLKDNHKK
ncbi:MAG: glycoside hydrolase family 43 protein [Bacteroidales bacterium]|nr:glycoside hydrolase family 43 protein [Bacteroidales bacterium]